MRRESFLTIAILLSAAAASAQVDPGTLVISGGGWTGSWDTEIELGDSPLGVGTQGSISFPSPLLGAPCPVGCASVSFTIPPKGTVRIRASEFIGGLFEGPHMLRVSTVTEQPLPVIHSRIVNGARPIQSAELPVLLESTLLGLHSPALVFPGASRSPEVHSNLILQSIEDGGLSEVLIEVFGPDGALLGSGAATIDGEGSLKASLLVDIVGGLGVASLDGGQIRVTRESGGGTLWGILAVVSDDGRLAISAGANP